jgi:hypothetical protein
LWNSAAAGAGMGRQLVAATGEKLCDQPPLDFPYSPAARRTATL